MGRVLIKGGVWRNTEDEILKAAVMKYGKNQWSRIASLLHRKSAKQCKARWNEWLDPSIKKTEWSREEEEKLINLVRLMPTQWRTIASLVGRTASQCLEHYEQLLDQVQNKDKEAGLEDPRKLKPGEIDPNPETKPARPDPKDMDEDELEMLSEARARLANTQGKKAKRKAREKQLEEARRLATLQKRRELRTAGINLQIKNWKHKRFVDYNNEIPFEKAVPAGFHDTTEDAYNPSNHDFKRLRQQHFDGELPSEREERERKKDKEKAKKKKENGIPNTLNAINEVVRPRSKLVLPAPVISEGEIAKVVKLGKASELAKETAEESGHTVSGALLSDYTLTNSVNSIRTPKTSVFSRDNILMEAQNLIALTNVETPLKGGQNVPLMDIPEANLQTPAGLTSINTPNTMISTPFRTVRDKDGQLVPMTPSNAIVPSSRGKTPAGGATNRTDGFATPAATPLRDKLAINPEEAFINETAMAEQNPKQYLKEMKDKLSKAFSSLPTPQNQYEIVINDEDDKGDEAETAENDIAMTDQSEVAAKEDAEKKAKLLKEEKFSQVVQRQLPRPVDVLGAISVPASSENKLLAQAEEMIKEEMTKLIYFDAFINPTPEQMLVAAKKSAKATDPAKRYDNILAKYLESHDIERFYDQELIEAKSMIEQEMEVVREGMRHDPLTVPEYTKVWEECHPQLLYLPSDKRYTRAVTATKNAQLEWAKTRLEHNREHMAREKKKATSIAAKIDKLVWGYQNNIKKMLPQFQEMSNSTLEQLKIDHECFKALEVNEQRAIEKRIAQLQADVGRQQEREKSLQRDYEHLTIKLEELKSQAN